MKAKKYILIFASLMVLMACHTKKAVVQKPIEQPNTPIANSTEEIIRSLEKNQPDFKTANISKMAIDINIKERQYSVGGACQMVTDSAIHFSVMPVLGIEMFKLELSPKEFILIDKFNKKYYKSSYDFFKSSFGINLNYFDIQSLISNKLFLLGKSAYAPEDFLWQANNSSTHTLTAVSDKVTQQVNIDSEQLKRIIQLIFKTMDGAYLFSTSYSDFQNNGSVIFPQKIQIYAEQGGVKKASFDFDIQKITFNEPVKLKSTSLSKYAQGDIYAFFKK